MMYQCSNSKKCISKQRLVDGFQDCPENDDEEYQSSCSLDDVRQRFQCIYNDPKKCISFVALHNTKIDCNMGEDETGSFENYKLTHIYFQNICDGEADLLPIQIDGKYETDETECKDWPCGNIYAKCSPHQKCENRIDRILCSKYDVSSTNGICESFIDNHDYSCISIDENTVPKNEIISFIDISKYIHCWDNKKSVPYKWFCGQTNFCLLSGFVPFCSYFQLTNTQLCHDLVSSVHIEGKHNSTCIIRGINQWKSRMYFKVLGMSTFPLNIRNMTGAKQSFIEKKDRSIKKTRKVIDSSAEAWRCTRGISVRIRIDFNKTRLYCLCPPSYYGDKCQYQNERVSITLQIQVLSNWTNIIVFLITLIDNEKHIDSYEYVEYLPSRDCNTKYNRYLLYSTRPKNSSKKYFVKIDAYDQAILKYRTSWIFPIQFPFLPVHHLPVLLKVPLSIEKPIESNCWPPCIHGQCHSYINNDNLTQCHCESGWSGTQCNIQHLCKCAFGSLCISDSICLCSASRFGRRCYLRELSCQSNPCLNDGQCILQDVRYRSQHQNRLTCVCRQGYTGDRCEHQQNQTEIDLSFDELEIIPSAVLIHFIFAEENGPPQRNTIMKKIEFDEYSTKISTSVIFHMAFAQISHDYYLIIVRENEIYFEKISTKIVSEYRCRSIVVLFDETFLKQHLLKRIKYYFVPCEKYIGLNCFYDELHICLCTQNRQVNCFEFNHNMTYDCNDVEGSKLYAMVDATRLFDQNEVHHIISEFSPQTMWDKKSDPYEYLQFFLSRAYNIRIVDNALTSLYEQNACQTVAVHKSEQDLRRLTNGEQLNLWFTKD
ncbi:hypothetical protein I4U23_004280 [Adineta vaga]|nr:hypothetical protein I4U23_004280 [Adineta vaga]